MILAIRISGQVEMRKDFVETLFRMRMRKKYSAVLIKENEASKPLIQSVRNFIAYGPIDQKTLEELISKRGKPLDKKIKIDAKKTAEIIMKDGIEKAGIKPFFRLHPPRKGINSKIHFPKGVLGDNGDKINDLVRRML